LTRDSITASRAGGLTIGAVSRQTGVSIETIRYYEKIRMLPPPPRTAGGRRVYGTEEVRKLSFIRRGRELGLTLGDIRGLLRLGMPGQASCLQVCAVATRHLDDIRARIADLQKLEQRLSSTIAQCADSAPDECAVLDALYP
jgi:MerR family mercuric resistance operon transcriptional regulator